MGKYLLTTQLRLGFFLVFFVCLFCFLLQNWTHGQWVIASEAYWCRIKISYLTVALTHSYILLKLSQCLHRAQIHTVLAKWGILKNVKRHYAPQGMILLEETKKAQQNKFVFLKYLKEYNNFDRFVTSPKIMNHYIKMDQNLMSSL